MAKSIAPFYQGGSPSFPLSFAAGRPYNSRIEEQELAWSANAGSNDQPKNYQFVAFRPGFALQASELNEIQERFQMQMSLSISMMHNWITSGAGPNWWGATTNYPGDGGDVDSGVPNTGIGVGGGVDGGHESANAISGPGWRGSTPLHPFDSPYRNGTELGPVSVEEIGEGVKITINPGWWLVELRDDTSNSSVPEISGMKHWIYIDKSFDTTVPVSSNTEVDIPVGLVLESHYYRCCETSDDPANPCDPDLGDNAAGFSNPVACGASRYGVNAVEVDHAGTFPIGGEEWSFDGIAEYEKLSLVCKVNPLQRTVRYMNNLLIATF